MRFRRYVDQLGYLRFRHWWMYAEAGLTGYGVAVWLYEEQLLIVYDDVPLATYTVDYQPDHQQLRDVTQPQLFDTAYRSPQLKLWEPSDEEWRKVYRLPHYIVRRQGPLLTTVVQEALDLSG